MAFPKEPTTRRVRDSISQAIAGIMQKRRAKEQFAFGRESEIGRIVHAATHESFDGAAHWMTTIDVCGLGRCEFPVGFVFTLEQLMILFGKSTFGPIDPTIGPHHGAMQVVRTACHGRSVKPHFARLKETIVIFVGQSQYLRRRGY